MSTTKTQVKDKKLPDLLALHGSLKITIIKAKNLPLPFGSAPFVKILVGQHQIRTTQARLLSDFKLTPGEVTWNETFEFGLNNDTREVKLQLMDWVVPMSKNPVGTLRMSIGEFVSGSLAGILREKQILLQKGDGEDAALMGGTDRWFPSDRKPTLVDMTFNYEPALSATLAPNSDVPSYLSPVSGPSVSFHHPSPQLTPLGLGLGGDTQSDAAHHSHRGAFVHCPLSNYKVFLPFRQPCSALWHSRRKQEKKTGMLAASRSEGSGVLMKALDRPSHVFALPASFLEMTDPVHEFFITSLADWSLAERWNKLREFSVKGPSIRQGMGLNDLIPLHVEGEGDKLGEAASLALWGTQDKTREVEAGILYEIDKHGSAFFFNAWKQQQIRWLKALNDPAASQHTDAQWYEAWDRLMKEVSKGGRRKVTRNVLSLKLLLLAHATRRPIVVLHDEDYARCIIERTKGKEEAKEMAQLLQQQNAKGRKAQVMRAAKQRREMTTEERARTADKVLIFQHETDVGNVSSAGLGGMQMGQLSDVNLQGVYLPWHYPQFKRVHSPLVLIFCSKTGGFAPLVTQEGQHSELFATYPWPPLLALSSRSGNSVLPVHYALEMPPRREVHDQRIEETLWMQPEEIVLREWLACEEPEQTTHRIMISSAATNLRRARRVRTLYAVVKEAQCTKEFWSVVRKVLIFADHYRYITTKQAANEMTGIEISDHMVDLHPFAVDEYFCREADSMEFAMLKKFAQTKQLDHDAMMIQQRRRWMLKHGDAESKEKTEAAGLERHHFLLQLAGLGIRREDLDDLGQRILEGIESLRDDWDGEEQQEGASQEGDDNADAWAEAGLEGVEAAESQ